MKYFLFISKMCYNLSLWKMQLICRVAKIVFLLSGRRLGIIFKHKFWQFMNWKFIKWQMFVIESSLCRDYVWEDAFIFWQRERLILRSYWNIVYCYQLCFASLKSKHYILWLSKVTGKYLCSFTNEDKVQCCVAKESHLKD
jgi:hypothetical protein